MNSQQNPEKEVQGNIPNPRWRPFLIGFFVLLISLLMILGFSSEYLHFKKVQEETIKDELPMPAVRVMIAKLERKQRELVLPSYLQAINITPIWARTNGYLSNFYVDIGDKVKPGQLLAEIETPEVDQQLAQARGELASSKAQFEIARITAERWQSLYRRNPEAISIQDVEQKASIFQSSTANVETAIANVRRLEALQSFNRIYAPFEGIIIQRDIDIGSLISAGNRESQELFRIARIDTMRAFVDVPQAFYRLIKDGIEAQITVQEYPDKIFKGIVVRNAGALDPIARTLRTQVNIDNANGDLLPGLYAEVKFTFIPETARFIAPIDALIIISGPPFVAIVDENQKVKLQQIEIGRNFGRSFEILKGVKEKDAIIINPPSRLKDGMPVRVVAVQENE